MTEFRVTVSKNNHIVAVQILAVYSRMVNQPVWEHNPLAM
jgi:hypothetical protein